MENPLRFMDFFHAGCLSGWSLTSPWQALKARHAYQPESLVRHPACAMMFP